MATAQAGKPDYTVRISIIKKNIRQYFFDSSKNYYREIIEPRPKDNPFSHLWPLCGLIQAANEYESLSANHSMIDDVLQNIQDYYDPAAPAPGYAAYIVKEKKDSRFYDDNQWIGIACMDAYERTKKEKYLQQGQLVYRFMMTAYDTTGGGGLYWKENDPSTKNTCSNGPGVLVALQLYKATNGKSFLDTAIMLYEWTKAKLLSPKNIYYDHVQFPSRKIDTRTYTYNTGTMLQSAVLLYTITKEEAYLRQAKQLAKGSLKLFFKNGTFPDHYWFNAVLLRGYIDAMRQYGERIWKMERDTSSNLIGKNKRKELLDQAAVMEIYARLAMFN
jgi:predicted alpha-1,6-mannanase (GH76 family)